MSRLPINDRGEVSTRRRRAALRGQVVWPGREAKRWRV